MEYTREIKNGIIKYRYSLKDLKFFLSCNDLGRLPLYQDAIFIKFVYIEPNLKGKNYVFLNKETAREYYEWPKSFLKKYLKTMKTND